MTNLGGKNDKNLNCKDQAHDIVKKLNRANAVLHEIRNYVSLKTLNAIYFAILNSRMNYGNLFCGQSPNSKLRITLLKKALGTINNQLGNSGSGPMFKTSNILKFQDKILIGNIIFISKSINNFYHQFSKISSYSVLRFTTRTQCRLQLINYSSLPIELTPMAKFTLL